MSTTSPAPGLGEPDETRPSGGGGSEPTSDHTSATSDTSGRLFALDAARGLALTGMIIVNVGPTTVDNIWERLYLIPYGRASVLFVVIAGMGITFFLRSRAQARRRWPTLLWRAGVLLLGGLTLQLLTNDVGIILPIYGVLFAAVPLLQYLPRMALIATAAVLTILGPALFLTHVKLENGSHPGTPVRLGDSLGEIAHGLFLSGSYPVVTWVVPFLVGMWIAHLQLTSRPVVNKLLLWGGVFAAAGLIASQLARAVLGSAADRGYLRLLTGAAHGQMPLWLVSSVGGAIFTVALLLRFWRALQPLAPPFVAAGQLALSLYVLHVVVLALLNPPADMTFAEGAALSALMIGSGLVLASLWRRRASIGPLEWVLRGSWLHSRHPHRDRALPSAVPRSRPSEKSQR